MDSFMEVFVDTAFNISFSIGVDLWDTVLSMKQKIEKSQRIPVSKQTLYFDSKVLDDNLDIVQCQIFNNSRVFLAISADYNPNENNDQLPYQTEQSPSGPSDQSNQFVYPQDWPVMDNNQETQTEQSLSRPPHQSNEFVNPQAWPVTDNNQVTQTEQSLSGPSDQSNQFVNPQAWPVMVSSNNDQVLPQTEPPLVTAESVSEFLEYQDLPQMMEGRNNQLLHQNEQLSTPSNSIGETIYSQDQALSDMSNIQRFGLGKTVENIHGQYSPVMMEDRNKQVLHQNEQLSRPSNSIGDTIYGQDEALRIDDISNIQRFGLGKTVENIHGQYSLVMMDDRNNQVLHQNEQLSVPSNSVGDTTYGHDHALSDISNIQRFGLGKTKEITQGQYAQGMVRNLKNQSLPSNSSKEFLGTQGLPPVPVESSRRNKNKGILTEKSPQSLSVKRKTNTLILPVEKRRKRRKSSPVKLTVMVQPFEETRKIPVYVNSDEIVEELKKKLATLQEMGVLALPKEGYFFIHKQDVLTDHQTFEENLVAPGDTIEIFPGHITYDGSVPPKTRISS